ncbi:MAG: alpha/beta fold hydrolase [Planctomycetes bacterium]|nr:alpha/beta fold hydrolase [Planctomycetota bacterium]
MSDFPELRNHEGERLDATFAAGEADNPWFVVIGHGVTGNKDRPWAVTLQNALTEAGYGSVRFSFAGNGDSEGSFEASTISKEVRELRELLGVLEAAMPHARFVYAGHSQGGAVGALAAARERRIKKLVSLAGMVHTAQFYERKFGDLEPGSAVMWDKPECPLSPEYEADMRSIGNVLDAAEDVRVPWLLVHGTADTVVPLADSHDVYGVQGRRARLVELEGVDHVFSGGADAAMAAVVVDWLGTT